MEPRHEQASDAEPLKASGRDPEAFGTFVRSSRGGASGYFQRRTADPEAAADLAAETFAAAFYSRRRYRDTGAPGLAWLFGIARHELADAIRKERVNDRARRPDRGLPLFVQSGYLLTHPARR